MTEISLRLGLQQRVLPNYRAPFFELLATVCTGGLGLFAGQPRDNEAIESITDLNGITISKTRNLHFLRRSAYFCWQLGILKWLESWNPQVLILEANPRYLSSRQAIAWMHARHRPVIGWGLGAPTSRSGLFASSRRRFLTSFDAMIAYSARGADEYASMGIDPKIIFIAPNAVAGRPANLPPDRPAEKGAGRLTVLSIGRLQARKRIDLLIRACAQLPDELQPELLIVGDGPEREEFESLAINTYPRTQFLGARHGTDLEPFFKKADLFVLPGTGGLAVQQAMAHALPVIVSEADGTQTDLVRTENGWVLPPGDLSALTSQLENALRDLPRLRRMGNESYRIVKQEINIENMVEVFSMAVQTACSSYACTMS
jgi:glycosyltransferase involved in cell wall biosynthesis